MKIKRKGQAGAAGADEKVKVSLNDTIADFLKNKILAGVGITVTEINDGGDEDLEIAATGVPSSIITKGFIEGLQIKNNSVSPLSKIDIEIGSARDSTNTFDIDSTSILTVDITASGANGLDTGLEAADTFYAVFVIADSTATNPVAGLFSISGTAPTLPTGYDKFRRVGWARNNITSRFLKFNQRFGGRTRRYWYDEVEDDNRVLVSGNATVFTTIDLSAFVPPTSENLTFHAQFEAGTNTHKLDVRINGSTVDQSLTRVAPGVKSTKKLGVQLEVPCNSSQEIQYKVTTSSNSAHLSVAGFDDEI